jgi:hypothetical protein
MTKKKKNYKYKLLLHISDICGKLIQVILHTLKRTVFSQYILANYHIQKRWAVVTELFFVKQCIWKDPQSENRFFPLMLFAFSCRWEDNIKMDLQEVGRGCGDWMELAQDRERWRTLVSTVMKFRVSYNAGNFLIRCKTS